MIGARLDTWHERDAASLLAMAKDGGWRNLTDPYLVQIKTTDQARRVIGILQGIEWSFCIRIDEDAVGGVLLFRHPAPKHHTVELGFWILEPARGLKLYREVWGPGIDFLRKQGIWRIEAKPYPWSDKTISMCKSLGFTLEGIAMSSIEHEGKRTDELMFAYVLPEDGE